MSFLGLLGNGAGVIVGGMLVSAPEPTMATKVVGGAVLTKSVTGWGLNWYNLTLAMTDDSGEYDAPGSAGRLAAELICPGNDNAQRAADASELILDLLSGRLPIGSVPQGGSALNRAVNVSESFNFGRIGTSPINHYIDTMQVIQTIQYGSDGASSIQSNF